MLQLARSGFHRVICRLAGEPFRELTHPGFKIDFRRKAQPRARLRDVGETVPDVASAILPRYLGTKMRPADDASEIDSDGVDGAALPRADVVDISATVRGLQCKLASLSDILHMHEIPALIAVFKNQRGAIVEKSRGENREHPRVWI